MKTAIVTIMQYRLLHYREGLFNKLKVACKAKGVELQLVHGQATRREKIKKDEGFLDWAITTRNRVLEIGPRDIIWQPLPEEARNSDLIIVMQENRILSNYLLLLSRIWSKRKVAFWGHGRNFQAEKPTSILEKWKSLYINTVDWWFAYTGMTVKILEESGYHQDNITNLENAIDTDLFKKHLNSWSDNQINEEKYQLGIPLDAPIGLFCGSLYPYKNLELLMDSVNRIKEKIPNFHLLVIGDGPSMEFMKSAQANKPWIHLLGVKYGEEKALYFRMSKIMLNPGLVGLHIVDAFCAGLVMVTTKGAKHSPEVDYLKNEQNGLMTGNSVAEFSDAIIELLENDYKLNTMQAQALDDSEHYTVDNMVNNFAEGIYKAIHQTRG